MTSLLTDLVEERKLERDTFRAVLGARPRSWKVAQSWFDNSLYAWLERNVDHADSANGPIYHITVATRRRFARWAVAKAKSDQAVKNAVDKLMSNPTATATMTAEDARRWINDMPVKLVGCPGCGYRAGHHHTKTCITCEECSTCCMCKGDDKKLVDLATWVPILITRL